MKIGTRSALCEDAGCRRHSRAVLVGGATAFGDVDHLGCSRLSRVNTERNQVGSVLPRGVNLRVLTHTYENNSLPALRLIETPSTRESDGRARARRAIYIY